MKKCLLILLVLLAAQLPAQIMAVHWYLPALNEKQTEALIGYDWIIIDPEVAFTSRANVDKLRATGAKIICYINVPENFDPMFPDKPWSIMVLDFLKSTPEFWLYGNDGERISFWPGMYTMNMFSDGPRLRIGGKSQNYVEFATELYVKYIFGNYKFDGVLSDNMWNRVMWLGNYKGNRSGIKRPKNSLPGDEAWRQGTAALLRGIRQAMGPDFIIVGNPANLDYLESCNVKQFEDFSDRYVDETDTVFQAWYANMEMAASMPLAIFNARKENPIFTLASTMLVDNAIFSYAQNTAFNPEWKLDLGKPLGKAYRKGEEHIREYQNGYVWVNPRTQSAGIVYNDGRTLEEGSSHASR